MNDSTKNNKHTNLKKHSDQKVIVVEKGYDVNNGEAEGCGVFCNPVKKDT